jgi:hypothetical protein
MQYAPGFVPFIPGFALSWLCFEGFFGHIMKDSGKKMEVHDAKTCSECSFKWVAIHYYGNLNEEQAGGGIVGWVTWRGGRRMKNMNENRSGRIAKKAHSEAAESRKNFETSNRERACC